MDAILMSPPRDAQRMARRAVHAVGGLAPPSGHWPAARSAPRIGVPDDDLVLQVLAVGGDAAADAPPLRGEQPRAGRVVGPDVGQHRPAGPPRPGQLGGEQARRDTAPLPSIGDEQADLDEAVGDDPEVEQPDRTTTDRREGRRPRTVGRPAGSAGSG